MSLNIIVEIIRALCISFILILLLTKGNSKTIRSIGGWNYFVSGFSLLLLGSLIDVTDNFPSLNKFIIIGHTPYQAIIEKIIGYMGGFMLLAVGFWKWTKALLKYRANHRAQLQKTTTELKMLHGILPICSCCKSICDKHGEWERLEYYIKQHSEAKLSHGICPTCADKLKHE